MDSVFSPNTSAFLNYLNDFSAEDANKSSTQTAFPPSTFFNTMPVPGRDTPEDTPPSADTSVSPEPKDASFEAHLSDDSDDASPEPNTAAKQKRASITGAPKRKAGHNHAKTAEHNDEEDEESDSDVAGHEDKKPHGNGKASDAPAGSGRKGGRKSTGGEGKEPNKAARRKEQNRAAQKAFRERREARVKDLEDKVSELEAKSYGASVENENLRGILKRLQEENIALKQSAFTFSMPVNGTDGTNTPTNNANIAAPQRQVSKPPSPPQSSTDDSLKSIHDIPGSIHRNSTSTTSDSPDSLVSISSGNGAGQEHNQPPSLFREDAFNAFLFGNTNNNNNNRPNANPLQSQSSQPSADSTQSYGTMSTPSSSGYNPSTSQSDLDALWASLYPNGVEAALNLQPQQNAASGSQQPQQQTQQTSSLWNVPSSPFQLLNSQPAYMSFATAADVKSVPPPQPLPAPVLPPTTVSQPIQQADFNRFAFRDPSSEGSGLSDPMNTWNDITDNSMNDFLASLSGGTTNNDLDNGASVDDDHFNAQLQRILGGASPSNMFSLPNNKGFSPDNYLNMSPSPLQSISNGQSPQSSAGGSGSGSGSNGKSNSASPASSGSVSSHPTSISTSYQGTCGQTDPGFGTFGPPKTAGEIVHVVDENGNVIKPSDIWLKFGMHQSSVVDHLVIDDLCDQMRAKATCKDGQLQLSVQDAAHMFEVEGGKSFQNRLQRLKNGLVGDQ